MNANRRLARYGTAIWLATLSLLGGCAPMMTGTMAEGGFNAAKSAFGALSPTAAGTDDRQKRIQAVLNGVNVGDEIQPALDKIAEPPREKSGNAQGYTCYEFPSVYSATAAAVLVAHNGKIVFYGNSRCTDEMNKGSVKEGGASPKSSKAGAD